MSTTHLSPCFAAERCFLLPHKKKPAPTVGNIFLLSYFREQLKIRCGPLVTHIFFNFLAIEHTSTHNQTDNPQLNAYTHTHAALRRSRYCFELRNRATRKRGFHDSEEQLMPITKIFVPLDFLSVRLSHKCVIPTLICTSSSALPTDWKLS